MNLRHLTTHSTTVLTYKMAIVLRPYVTSFHPIYSKIPNLNMWICASLHLS